MYQSLGNTEADRAKTYQALISGNLCCDQLDEIRFAMNRELVLGSENFKDKIERVLNRQARPLKPGRPRSSEA
jgi:hypothetical protein